MHRLVVNPGTPHAWEIQLKPGSNCIGRGLANDFRIDHPSVSSMHCEIIVDRDSFRIRDLGSTNGTFVDCIPVEDAPFTGGQRVQLGSVEMVFKNKEEAINVVDRWRTQLPPSSIAPPPASPALVNPASADLASPGRFLYAPAPVIARAMSPPAPVADGNAVLGSVAAPPVMAVESLMADAAGPAFCKNHYQNAARFHCAKCNRFLCDLCVNTRGSAGGGLKSCKVCASPCAPVSMQSHVPKEVNFFRSVPAAFKYPVAGDGIILLICGAFFFGFLDTAYYIALNAGKYAARAMMMRAVVICFILGTGYLFSYLKKIVYATASGDPRMPDWPELSEWQADILAPMFHFLMISLLSFGPGLAVLIWYGGEFLWVVWLLLLAGCFYFPMALLGVAMFDTLAALNPLFVIGSILKVPGEYLVAALVFTAILGFRLLVETGLAMIIHIPLVPALLADLLGIYLLIVETRILGLLYFVRQHTLGWFKKRVPA